MSAYEIDMELMSVSLIRRVDKSHLLQCLDIPPGIATKMKLSPDVSHMAVVRFIITLIFVVFFILHFVSTNALHSRNSDVLLFAFVCVSAITLQFHTGPYEQLNVLYM